MRMETAYKKYSIEEYLKMEERSFEKHEYYNGKIIEKSSATISHNLIAVNILAQLNNKIDERSTNYFVLNSDMNIHIPRFNCFVYPDAAVVCETIEVYSGSEAVITSPLLIVEVLSSIEKQRQ